MMDKVKTILLCFLFFLFTENLLFGKTNFFEEGKKLFENKKYEKSKFLFERSIVFNPKKIYSYIYLAKIYKIEKNENEQKKNIKTALLLDPKNEEALFMLIDIELERSNISEVKELKEKFKNACSKLCDNLTSIDKRLNNIEAKDES